MTTFTMQDLTINDLPTTPEEDEIFKTMIQTQHAPVPQPTLADIVNNICTQLQLLTTIINQSQAETKAGENSLQDCVSITLQQADWFKDMVKDEAESRVEREVDMYFERRFDATDHFDFGDAVSSEVHDRIDDVVSDKIDEAVEEQLEKVVAEKLKSIRVVFD